MTKTYKINVKEILTRDIYVKADSKIEALQKAKDSYYNEEFVLNEDDFYNDAYFKINN